MNAQGAESVSGRLGALRELEAAFAALGRARIAAGNGERRVAMAAVTRALVAIEDAVLDLNRGGLRAAPDDLWVRMCASCRWTPVDKGPPFNGPIYCAGCESLRGVDD